MNKIYVVAAARTPMGSFQGALSSVPATALGSAAIRGALTQGNVDASLVDEVFMGHVLQASAGQAPARQAAMGAGMGQDVPCTTVNKVCASGMKAIALASQAIALGDADVVVAGGMENMSSVPHYMAGRSGVKFGAIKLEDGMVKDGLTDVYNKTHMGNCAELCAKENGITREEQDAFAIESYRRASEAWESGKFPQRLCLWKSLNDVESLWLWIATRNSPTFVWTKFHSFAQRLTKREPSRQPTHRP